jgi:hypothetical protein
LELFRVARERPNSENELLRVAEVSLRDRLPVGWLLRRDRMERDSAFDARLTLGPSDKEAASLLVDAKLRIGPRDVGRVLERWSEASRSEPETAPLLVTPYLSPRTRELLEGTDVSYVDSTGNVRIELRRPAVFIRTEGAQNDPWPPDSALRSLKGPAAARVVRAVIDFKPPYGISELAARSGSPLATTHRVIDLLDQEGLLERQKRGPITSVDWEGVLGRWIREYGLADSNRVRTYLEPRGLDRLLERLRTSDLDYAITGSFAAARIDPVAPSRLAMLFVDGDADEVAHTLGLRPTEVGANVLVIEPFDPVALERGPIDAGLRYAAVSQVAADLAKSPGRGPAEGEALVRWMTEHEDAWRT